MPKSKLFLTEISRRVREWAESEEGQRQIEEGVARGQETVRRFREARTVKLETWCKVIDI